MDERNGRVLHCFVFFRVTFDPGGAAGFDFSGSRFDEESFRGRGLNLISPPWEHRSSVA